MSILRTSKRLKNLIKVSGVLEELLAGFGNGKLGREATISIPIL